MSKQYYLTINGTTVSVSEEVYRVYKRPLWQEKKRVQRNMRCRDGSNIRCDKDCNECEFARFHGGSAGSDISVEGLLDAGADIEADTDILDAIDEKQRIAGIRQSLMEFDEKSRTIAVMLYEGYKQNEIAEYLGMSPAAVNKRVKKMRQSLKKFL